MKRVDWLALSIFISLIVTASSLFAQDDDAPFHIVAYYSSWSVYGQQYFVTDIPAAQLTHINYAFFNISDSGECILGDEWADVQMRYPGDPDGLSVYGNIRQLQLLRGQYPHLRILMSIGGATWSGQFSNAAFTPQSRQRFVQSCVAHMLRYDFDGIDVDWEFPTLTETGGRPEDRQNFTLLLAEFRRQLDEHSTLNGRDYQLSIAAPAIERFYSGIELDQIHLYLDWINVMGYGYSGFWSDFTNHDSRLFTSPDDPDAAFGRSTDAAINMYLATGTPPEKIVLGVPFYGRGWAAVPNVNNGLYQPFNGLPDGTWTAGFYDYSDLQANYFGTFLRLWDDSAQAAWLYNPVSGVTISYEDPLAIQAKAAYVRQHNLGGMMYWELANDDDAHTLAAAVYQALHNPVSQ